MKKYVVKQYQESDYAVWNAFVGQAKNATFLFHRNFMEYHKDRFEDFSLLVYDEEKLVALLPANREGNIVYSHQGLTYGGFIYTEKPKLISIITVFKTVLSFLDSNKIEKVFLKMIPSIYHQKLAGEVLYALFLAEAKLTRRDVLSVIDLKSDYTFSKIRKRGIKKGLEKGFIIKEETKFQPYWDEILIPNLKLKHDVKPVHSLDEIVFLQKMFPNNIRQFNVYERDKIVAGTTIFETETVAHCQYISKFGSEENNGSLDFLFDHLIKVVFAQKHFFDFGVSNESEGKKLNEGLIFWKESFGATTIAHDFYDIETAKYSKLENVII